MDGSFQAWVPWGAAGLLLGSLVLLVVAVQLASSCDLRSCTPFWIYGLVLFLFWCLGPALFLFWVEGFRIPVVPERPLMWLAIGVGALATYLAGGFAVILCWRGRSPPAAPGPRGVEGYLWMVTLLFLGLRFVRPSLSSPGLGYLISGLSPVLLVLGPVCSIHKLARTFSRPAYLAQGGRMAAILGLIGVLVLDGSRQTSAFLLVYLPVGLWAGGVSLRKILPAIMILGAGGFCLMAVAGILRVRVNEVDFRSQRSLRSFSTYGEALKKTSLTGELTLMNFNVDGRYPFAPLVGRLAQMESVWIMEASAKTGHRSGWQGFADLHSALLPQVVKSGKNRIYDSHPRYAVYGLREREGQKSSALPLRTLADTYERFRLPGVLAFHFGLGAWLTATVLLLKRKSRLPEWVIVLIAGAWAGLAAGAVEMTLLENIIRFTYGLARDAALVMLALLPLGVIALKSIQTLPHRKT